MNQYDDSDEKANVTIYESDSKHKWINSVGVIKEADRISVVINYDTPPENDPAYPKVAMQIAKLEGLKELFEGQLDHVIISDSISFKAGPKSKIRSVLRQADLPTDIHDAVMSNLEELWRDLPPK